MSDLRANATGSTRFILELNELKAIAENLARALGHATDCAKLNCHCTCGAGQKQAAALDAYERWKRA